MLWTDSALSQFFARTLCISLFFIACTCIWIGVLKTRAACERQEMDRQSRLKARKEYVPTFNHEYAALYLSLLEYIDELQKKP
jgi:hypothetical protein